MVPVRPKCKTSFYSGVRKEDIGHLRVGSGRNSETVSSYRRSELTPIDALNNDVYRVPPNAVYKLVDEVENILKIYNYIGKHGWEIDSRVGRNQTTVMWICDCWMWEGTTDRRSRSHLPQFTTSLEDRQFVCIKVTDRSVTSRNVAQHIESVTHHSASACTI
ncbi:transposable element Tcb1 transposase [Trichonephila clavipes]|nr:transposable element Tcb1 transposase [Trichonephila clavipes]